MAAGGVLFTRPQKPGTGCVLGTVVFARAKSMYLSMFEAAAGRGWREPCELHENLLPVLNALEPHCREQFRSLKGSK